MYLVKTINGDKIVETANEVKSLNKNEIKKIYLSTDQKVLAKKKHGVKFEKTEIPGRRSKND